MAQAINDTLDAAPFAGALWGLHIVNLDTGETLYSRNADQAFVPASNVKLATSAAALEQLGADYRYRTRLYIDGPVEDGVLHGNLIVRGDGDPTLGGYRQRQNPTRVFRQWADSLRAAGIRRIEGNIIGDPGPTEASAYGHGWTWDDLTHGYGAPIGGLVFNENKVDLTVQGRGVGEPARLQLEPFDTEYVTLKNETRTVPGQAEEEEEYRREPGTNAFRVQTRVHPNAEEETELAISDPSRYFVHSLRQVLLWEGVPVQGRAAPLDEAGLTPQYRDSTYRRVASYRSPPLSEIVQTLNRESRNLYAEQLLRTLALEVDPDLDEDADVTTPPDAAERGREAVYETLVRAGVDTSQVELADGSGLSRQNLLSPRAVIQLLQYAWNHNDSTLQDAFYESLPRGGQDGTLEYRYRNAGTTDVRAKTGTLSHVSTLSGYVTSAQGTPLAFSLLCNHHVAEAEQVQSAQDVVVNTLSRLSL
ncbi:MAG: D-alanyl-D-alanine carboxypeptidase/D-alanyl-D-alanine-endopeptidase [Salinivenus sp.]